MTDRYERIRAALADMDAGAEARNALAWRDAHAWFVVHVAPDTIRAMLEELDALRTENERLRAQLASRGGVPEGYVLMPADLTDDMAEEIARRGRMCGGGAFELWEALKEIAAAPSPEGQEAEPERLRLVPLTERMPDPDKHPRVVVYTEGYDFQGEQFFDVDAESLNENRYADPADQPEVCRYATHWIGANVLACLAKAIAHPTPAEGQAGEREAFEQAAEAMGFDLSQHWGQPGNNFESDDTRLGYEIWQKAWRAALAAQQQPEPDVSALVEALECMLIGACAVAVPHNGERAVLQDAVSIARAALAEHRKQGGEA